MTPLLDVQNLSVTFDTDDGVVQAVSDLSFHLDEGEILGIVGESGSGKSVSCLAMMGLVPSPPGRVQGRCARFEGEDLLTLSARAIRKVRGDRISMIFQDPMTSLNPYLRVSSQLTEAMRTHRQVSRKDALDRAVELLDLVHIPDASRRIHDYPHQFSGGMRQRVMIAMALMLEPKILIADEPTTALDVTIQAQILDLLGEIRQRLGTSMILITHDLGVVAGVCDRVGVMYAGRFCEMGPTDLLFSDPSHPYTRGLLRSVPRIDRPSHATLSTIQGNPPNMTDPPAGCAFHPRCEEQFDRCLVERPEWMGDSGEGQKRVACWLEESEAEGSE
ncbi:MAG: ABC transporter ATP-binding protein [Planctomycetota bacterium]|jgi:oligopeptide transport system ATP-binding protein|nr:ABC transporter ATP-binding protein [Planctomycetota bacterium]